MLYQHTAEFLALGNSCNQPKKHGHDLTESHDLTVKKG